MWLTNLLDRYLARPSCAPFEDMCFAAFASRYKVVYKKKTTNTTEVNQADSQDTDSDTQNSNSVISLKNNLGFIRKRMVAAVIRYPRFSKAKNSECYFLNLLKVYWPHRTFDLQPSSFDTYESLFNSNAVHC